MKAKVKYHNVYKGLKQIPTRDLKRGLKTITEHSDEITYEGAVVGYEFKIKEPLY